MQPATFWSDGWNDMKKMISLLNRYRVDWPELAIIKRSLAADKNRLK
jgi:hypothetical protein